MTQKVKIALGIIALIAVVMIGVVVTNPQLVQGRIMTTPAVTKAANLACPATWTKALTGSYVYDPGENASSDRAPLTGISVSQVMGLANAIESGCDMKVQFRPATEGMQYTTVTCQVIDIQKDGNNRSVWCRFDQLLPTIYKTYIILDNEKYMYDRIIFWTDQGKQANISKDRYTNYEGDKGVLTVGSLLDYEGARGTKWNVDVFLKK